MIIWVETPPEYVAWHTFSAAWHTSEISCTFAIRFFPISRLAALLEESFGASFGAWNNTIQIFGAWKPPYYNWLSKPLFKKEGAHFSPLSSKSARGRDRQEAQMMMVNKDRDLKDGQIIHRVFEMSWSCLAAIADPLHLQHYHNYNMVPLVPLKGQWKHPTRSSCKLWSNTLPTHIVPQEIALELQNRDECDRIAGMYTDISLSHETGHVCFLSAWMVSSIISLTRFSAQVLHIQYTQYTALPLLFADNCDKVRLKFSERSPRNRALERLQRGRQASLAPQRGGNQSSRELRTADLYRFLLDELYITEFCHLCHYEYDIGGSRNIKVSHQRCTFQLRQGRRYGPSSGGKEVGCGISDTSTRRRRRVSDPLWHLCDSIFEGYSKDLRRIFEAFPHPLSSRGSTGEAAQFGDRDKRRTDLGRSRRYLGAVESFVRRDRGKQYCTRPETPNTYKGTPVPGQCISEPFSHPIIYNN